MPPALCGAWASLPASSIRRSLFLLRAALRFGSATASGRSGSRGDAPLRSTSIRLWKSWARTIPRSSASPPWIAKDLLPGLTAPDEFRGILNVHFHVKPPPGQPAILGVVNAEIEWLFAFPDRLSVTISNADRLIDRPREALAAEIWREAAALTGLADDLPPWQIVKEKRATFAATPAQNAKRPNSRTRWANVVLAGDWVQTGLPATIEGAVRSGYKAASIITGTGADAPRRRAMSVST